MKYLLLLLLMIASPVCYGLEAAAQLQLQRHAVDIQSTEPRVVERGTCRQITCSLMPGIVFILLVAYVLIHKSLEQSASLLEVE